MRGETLRMCGAMNSKNLKSWRWSKKIRMTRYSRCSNIVLIDWVKEIEVIEMKTIMASSSKMQNCFLHRAIYPENYGIEREQLIKIFILDTFLDKRKSSEALIVQGHAILEVYNDVRMVGDRVKMHNPVRSMALKIMEGKTMVSSWTIFDKNSK